MGPLDFFATLFGDSVNENNKLVIWESSRKSSRWHSDILSAVAHCEELSKTADTYFGVCLQRGDAERPGARGDASTTSVLGGLWIDIDLAGPTHSKVGLPKSDLEVRKAVQSLPLPPSMVLATGGGYHLWWAFREPYMIETDAEREAIAAATMLGWWEFCKQQFGFKIDSTFSLGYVMRIPGLVNHKYGTTVQLASWANAKKRPLYNISDFEGWRTAPVRSKELAPTSFSISEQANPPTEKFLALLETDAAFKQTWYRKRVFPSQSEYDFALGSRAVHVGWSDQEVIDMLIAHRRQVDPGAPKIERKDYFERTLGKLRAEANADKKAVEACEKIVAAAKEPETKTGRNDAITQLSAALGFAVDRIIKYPADPPVYRIEMPEGAITIGGVEGILNFNQFRAKIAAVTSRVLPKAMARRWEGVASAILAVAEVRDLGEASEPGKGVQSFLREYIGGISRLRDDRNEAAKSSTPWMEDDMVWFWSARLQTWLSVRGIKVSFMELAVQLRTAGAQPRTVAVRRADNHTTTTRVWGIPREMVETSLGVGQRAQPKE